MKYLTAMALTFTIVSSPASAADMPQYDSASFCKATSSIIVVTEDFKKMMLESCLEKEQKAPDQIMRVIPYVDAAAIKSCDVLTRAYAGGSYQGFAGCLGLIIMTSVLDGKLELSFPKRPREQ